MAYNPENLEKPNSSEKDKRRTVSAETAKKLGQTAVKGANKG